MIQILRASECEKGGLLMRNQQVSWCCPDTDNKWTDVETLPERIASPLEQWAFAKTPEEISPEFDIDAAVRLTRVMEAAYSQYK